MTPMDPPRRNLTGAIVPAIAAAALAGLGAIIIVSHQATPAKADGAPVGCVLDNLASFGGPISLLDQNGRTVTQADFSSGPAVLYFGFTHCPDVCPTAMYALSQALAEPGGFDVQPVMITVDPERDTPDVMRAYVTTDGFPAGLTGLTGTPEQVRTAANEFRVFYRKAPIEGAEADVYNVDHSSMFYVVDSHWQTRAVMNSHSATPQDIAACIGAGLSRANATAGG